MMVSAQQIDIQGHRGCRGLLPENSIPAFLRALDLGVTTLEMDVVISKDGKVVVSHEPFLNHDICLNPEGDSIKKSEEETYNLYQMNYNDIAQCDCGSLGNSKFKEQESIKVSKPLLSDVIKQVEWYIKSYTRYEVDYNIEIKSTEQGDNVNHPMPAEFSDIVYNEIDKYLPWNRIVIQSFDFRVLKYWKEKYPEARLAALVENENSIDANLKDLGFNPAIYSCYHQLLSEDKVQKLHDNDIKVIPWTVNDTSRMTKLVKWGVDGIITDYPNKAVELGLITPRREIDQ